MPRWKPEAIWEGKDVFIIGGGNSLKTFDWSLLRNEYTIGCNDAYTHGAKICKICIFGDAKWFKVHEKPLSDYAREKQLPDCAGIVFTSCPQLQHTTIRWIWLLVRKSRGLHTDALGWNDNTGAEAINLALILGAKRIYLLGFDMHLSEDGKSNWHPNNLDLPNPGNHLRHLKGYGRVAYDLKNRFPGREVINVTEDSSLNVFPKMNLDLFFKERNKK